MPMKVRRKSRNALPSWTKKKARSRPWPAMPRPKLKKLSLF